MSDSEATTETEVVTSLDPPTEQIIIGGADGHVGSDHVAETAADDDEWPDRGPKKGIRMSVPTMVLLALLIAAGGIWGGAALQRGQGPSGSTRASSLASLFGGRGGAGGLFSGTGTGTGTGTGAAALGGATAGTVTEVTGSTLYVTNSSGDLVKVTVGPTATVDRNAASSLSALQVGDTVVVEGTKATDGSVTATSVSATGAGVTSPLSRFGTGTGAGG